MREHLAAIRALIVLTVLTGIAYPLVILAVAQLPGLHHDADGSLVTLHGTVVGSSLVGQSFTDKDGNPIPKYFQTRPGGYDPTATGASNLGPESVVDTLPDPSVKDDAGKPSLLIQVCARSLAVGKLENVSGARPFCTADGVGAVLAVFADHAVSVNQACPATPFVTSWQGKPVRCATFGEDYGKGVITPVRGDAPADPAVPADAVTASGSGLDPQISVAYADLQAPRVARERGLDVTAVRKLINDNTTGRALGFMGEPGVNVLKLNVALDSTG